MKAMASSVADAYAIADPGHAQKILEDAGIKLSTVASHTISVSGRAMIEALIAGERDPLSSPTSPKPGCAPRSPPYAMLLSDSPTTATRRRRTITAIV